MSTQFELFEQMTIILDNLVENAKKMKDGIRLKYSQKQLESLQQRQHEILMELGELNKLLDSSPLGASADELEHSKSRIRDRLGHFQSINQEFFDHISSQSRVIDSKDAKKNKSP